MGKLFLSIVLFFIINVQAIEYGHFDDGSTPTNDQALAQAAAGRKDLKYVAAGKVVVTRLLQDDRSGRAHQKWIVRLSNGKEIMAVYNIDVANKIPLKVGDEIAVAGEYIADGAGLIHWLHEDPKDRRPDGYVEVNGVRYGQFLQ